MLLNVDSNGPFLFLTIFYPNGGKDQPGCFQGVNGTKIPSGCSHERSHQLFIDSIESRENGLKNVGLRCTDYGNYLDGHCFGEEQNLMGYFAQKPTSARSFYYFKTRDEKPFGLTEIESYGLMTGGAALFSLNILFCIIINLGLN